MPPRSQPAWLLPRRALPDERLARKPLARLDGVASSVTARLAAPSSRLARRTPRQETAGPAGRRCLLGHSPPGCSLVAPCQTNASPGNRWPGWTALPPRSQPAWLLPRRALPDERLARKPLARLDGVASSVTARLAAPSSRLARRTPRQETAGPAGRRCLLGHSPPGCSLVAPCQTNASPGNRWPGWTALPPRSQPAWLLPRRALPDERLARKPLARLDGVASSVTARLAAPSSRLARRTPRQETAGPAGRRCLLGHSPPGCSLVAPCQTNASPGNRWPGWTALPPRSQPAWLLPRRALPDERLARKPLARLDGVASSVTARLAAPSSRLARRTPRQETAGPAGRRRGEAPSNHAHSTGIGASMTTLSRARACRSAVTASAESPRRAKMKPR